MPILRVYLQLYATCFVAALHGIGRNPWTLLLPIGLWAVLLAGISLFAGFGIVGGILFGLLLDAVFSSYLYFTGEIVAQQRARLGELKGSFGAFFWAVMGVAFVVWIAELLLATVLAQSTNGWIILLLARAAAFVLCNAAPEVIYQKQTQGGLATITQSIAFIHENWIEWFIPNLALAAVYYFAVRGLFDLGVPDWALAIVAGALLHLLMVFRGHLFRQLATSSHRQRMFKWRQSRDLS